MAVIRSRAWSKRASNYGTRTRVEGDSQGSNGNFAVSAQRKPAPGPLIDPNASRVTLMIDDETVNPIGRRFEVEISTEEAIKLFAVMLRHPYLGDIREAAVKRTNNG